MTDKRFRVNTEDIGHIYIDNPNGEHMSWIEVEETLNELASDCSRLEKENEELKQEYNKLMHRHSLLHDVCIEAECDRDRYHKDVLSLEKENEKLKQKNDNLTLLSARIQVQNDGLKEENDLQKRELEDNLQFLIRASQRLGFESLDHLLYTLDKGEIYGYSTKNWSGD